MDNNKNDKRSILNLFKKKKPTYHYYGQDGEDEDQEEKGAFKLYLIALGLIMVVATVLDYNHLGGIEGIMSQKMLLIEGYVSYFAAVGSLFLMPILAVIFFWLAFRKPKKHYIEEE